MAQTKAGAIQSSSPPLGRPDPLTGSVRHSSPPLPRPKNLNQQTKDFLAPRQELKDEVLDPKYMPDTSLGDTEFDMEILPEFINPIGRLGHNVKNYDILFSDTLSDQPVVNTTEGLLNQYSGLYNRKTDRMSISDVRKGALSDYGLRDSAVAKNPTFEHEAIHRGLKILRDSFGTQDAFIKRGMKEFDFSKEEMEAAAKFLFVNDLYSELDIEVLTELNDSKRLGLPYAQTYNERFVGREFTKSGKKVTEKDLKKYTDRADKVGPVLKMMALDRLQDKNPKGGITDDAQNVPVKKYTPVKSKNFIFKNIDKIKDMYKQRKLNKKYEKTSTDMPSEFSGGGSVFRMGYSKADPETLAYYDSAKDELIYIDGGRIVKNPDDKILTIGLRVGAFKMLGKGQAKGGDVKMDKQMQMVFMDDGMDKDPVSGNEVPTGSLAEEVRDDVPAMLSEGEYVVPADVLRFYGMKFFEDLRMDAKIALAKMEAEGRIGGEPIDSKEPMKAAGGITVDNDPIIKLVRAIMKDQPSYSYEEAFHMANMFYKDKMKELGIVEGRNKGGVIKANTGITVGGGNMTAEQQAAQEAAQASASVTTSAGNAGYTAPIQAPSNQAFMQAVNVGSNAAPKTAKFISSNGALIDVLVGPDGLPLYGAPAGYVKASSPEGQQLMVQFGHSQADPNVAAPDATPEAIPTPKPKKDDKSGQDAFDRADKTRKEVEAAQTKAIERLGINDRADDYRALSFAQRASLALIEGKKMLDPEYVITETERNKINEVLDNPADSPSMLEILKNPLALLTGSSKQPDIESATVSKDRPKRKFDSSGLGNVGDLRGKSTDDKTTTLEDLFDKKDDEGKPAVVRYDEDKPDKEVVGGTTAGGANLDAALGISGVNKGALVTKRKRKPRVKRKSLGQK